MSTVPPPSSLKQLEDVLHDRRYSIALETVQNLRESIPRRTQAVLQAYGGRTPYQQRNVYLAQMFPLLRPSPVYI
jgi:hypothetical protein